MRFTKTALSATALVAMLATSGAYAATAAAPANVAGCLTMSKKVSAALDANQTSPNYDAAKAQARGAQGFCAHGMYQQGVNSYAAVLESLGAS